MEIIIATENNHKVDEIKKILNLKNIKFLSLADLPEKIKIIENGKTFAENAAKKAKSVADKFGLMAIADDSGLCVDALNGMPGVKSKRLVKAPATSDKLCKKLLMLLRNINETERSARFVCAVAISRPQKKSVIIEKECKGKIIHGMLGRHGFGFDPIFVPIGYKKTFAQMSSKEKNRASHRGKAFRKARKYLLELA